MRPIDADALDAKIYNEIPIKVFGTIKRMAAIREIIAQMPTIVPDKQEPVEPVTDQYRLHYRCGACGRLLNDSILFRDNFCRTCGKEVKWRAYPPDQEKVV